MCESNRETQKERKGGGGVELRASPPPRPSPVVLGSGFRVWGFGFKVWGLGFRVDGLGSRV